MGRTKANESQSRRVLRGKARAMELLQREPMEPKVEEPRARAKTRARARPKDKSRKKARKVEGVAKAKEATQALL